MRYYSRDPFRENAVIQFTGLKSERIHWIESMFSDP